MNECMYKMIDETHSNSKYRQKKKTALIDKQEHVKLK